MKRTATVTPGTDHEARPQHLRALERANEVRLARAELKRRIAAGELWVADIVLDSAWEAASMTLSDLLTSQRRWGLQRCRKLLATIPIAENKRLGTLTERQRLALASALVPRSSGARLAARLSEQMGSGQRVRSSPGRDQLTGPPGVPGRPAVAAQSA